MDLCVDVCAVHQIPDHRNGVIVARYPGVTRRYVVYLLVVYIETEGSVDLKALGSCCSMSMAPGRLALRPETFHGPVVT